MGVFTHFRHRINSIFGHLRRWRQRRISHSEVVVKKKKTRFIALFLYIIYIIPIKIRLIILSCCGSVNRPFRIQTCEHNNWYILYQIVHVLQDEIIAGVVVLYVRTLERGDCKKIFVLVKTYFIFLCSFIISTKTLNLDEVNSLL